MLNPKTKAYRVLVQFYRDLPWIIRIAEGDVIRWPRGRRDDIPHVLGLYAPQINTAEEIALRIRALVPIFHKDINEVKTIDNGTLWTSSKLWLGCTWLDPPLRLPHIRAYSSAAGVWRWNYNRSLRRSPDSWRGTEEGTETKGSSSGENKVKAEEIGVEGRARVLGTPLSALDGTKLFSFPFEFLRRQPPRNPFSLLPSWASRLPAPLSPAFACVYLLAQDWRETVDLDLAAVS